jgi:hypothetical protein
MASRVVAAGRACSATGQAPRLRAPRPRGSPAECGPLSACPRPSLSVSSHREHLGSQVGFERVGQPGHVSGRCGSRRVDIVVSGTERS